MFHRNTKISALEPLSLLYKLWHFCVSISNCSTLCLMPAVLVLTFFLGCITTQYPSSILVAASQSGIYVDNGRDQTIMHRVLDEDEKIAASYDILEFLGLPERPRRKHGHLSLR